MTKATDKTQPAPEETPPPEHDLMDRLLSSLAPDDLDARFDLTDETIAAGVEYAFAEDVLGEAFEIADLDHATWAAEHLKRRLDKIATVKQLADDRRARLAAWEQRETGRFAADCAYFESKLIAFHQRTLQTDPRLKTLPLPDGTELRSLAGRVSVEVTSVEEFQAWCDMAGVAEEYLRLPDPEVNKQVVGANLGSKAEGEVGAGEWPAIVAESGEIVPGVKIVRKQSRTYTVSSPK